MAQDYYYYCYKFQSKLRVSQVKNRKIHITKYNKRKAESNKFIISTIFKNIHSKKNYHIAKIIKKYRGNIKITKRTRFLLDL